MKNLRIIGILTSLLLFITPFIAPADETLLKRFTFEGDKPLKGWHEMVIDGRVYYFIDLSGNNRFVHAYSKKTCSSLYYRINFKPKDYPILKWDWCVLKFPDKEKKENLIADDYAARVYVIFPGFTFSAFRFIEYIWSEYLPENHIQKSSSANNIRQIVVRSGTKNTGEWFREKRNIREDYEKAFGQKLNKSAAAIAIMCNSNLTKSEAESLFDNIEIRKNNE